jgi:5-(carboxyamino)imidazole ribonucleotide synthase
MIGILGDGQLALMLLEAAIAQQQSVLVAGGDPDSPVRSRYPEYHVLNDEQKVLQACQTLILENEFYSPVQLSQWQKEFGFSCYPDLTSYGTLSSKAQQIRWFQQCKMPIPQTLIYQRIHWQLGDGPDCTLNTANTAFFDLLEAQLPYPMVLKRATGGYDGLGVVVVNSREQVWAICQQWCVKPEDEIIFQQKVDLKAEAAQSILLDGKGLQGWAAFFPVIRTYQQDGVCHWATTEHELSPLVLEQIEAIMHQVSKMHHWQGLYAFEFFIDQQDRVMVNEVAPRPHNSQHLSIDICERSQFDSLIDLCAQKNLAPGPVNYRPGLMINLLGQHSSSQYQLTLPTLSEHLLANLLMVTKLYHKKYSRPGRKLGHLNVLSLNDRARRELPQLGEWLAKEYRL